MILERTTAGDYLVQVPVEWRTSAPDSVISVPRLLLDLETLADFFSSPTPPWRFVRGTKISLFTMGLATRPSLGLVHHLQAHKVLGTEWESGEGIQRRIRLITVSYATW